MTVKRNPPGCEKEGRKKKQNKNKKWMGGGGGRWKLGWGGRQGRGWFGGGVVGGVGLATNVKLRNITDCLEGNQNSGTHVCRGVHRVTDLDKFPVRVSKDEALLPCGHPYRHSSLETGTGNCSKSVTLRTPLQSY